MVADKTKEAVFDFGLSSPRSKPESEPENSSFNLTELLTDMSNRQIEMQHKINDLQKYHSYRYYGLMCLTGFVGAVAGVISGQCVRR